VIKKLKSYGVQPMPDKRGKGSETILIRPESPGSKRGPQYVIKNHGLNTEISVPVIMAVLRRFDINPDEFFG
jgi:hypothetical protein